jgi:hypothetical protein
MLEKAEVGVQDSQVRGKLFSGNQAITQRQFAG